MKPLTFDYFCKRYANWKGLNAVCITFDIDFAPDYMIENILRILEQYNVTATFFITHFSCLLKELETSDMYEIGLHPNLDVNTLGTTRELTDIIVDLKHYYPTIVGNRFHKLCYSYQDLISLGQQGFLYDVSTLRFNCPYILPTWHQDIGMVLLTYTWEDGICENSNFPMELDSIDLKSPGLKIINFHPMNIYINGFDSTARLTFLRENPNFLKCPQSIADRYRCNGNGAEKILIDLLKYLTSKKCRFLQLKEMAKTYLNLVKQ